MPPCAATLWARRGLSWYQNDFTLYPASPSVAAAEPPARPVPTTMIVIFRRLAGLTRRARNRRGLPPLPPLAAAGGLASGGRPPPGESPRGPLGPSARRMRPVGEGNGWAGNPPKRATN